MYFAKYYLKAIYYLNKYNYKNFHIGQKIGK